jgi:hypothetical protein
MAPVMDQSYINSENIVARYLSGDLTLREAKDFEKYCVEHPEVAQQLPIPVRLKARLARRAEFADASMETSQHLALQIGPAADEQWEPPPRFTAAGKVVLIGLGAALAVAVAALIAGGKHVSGLQQEIENLNAELRSISLSAPSTVEKYRLNLVRAGPPTQPSLSLGWPNPAQFIELKVNLGKAAYNVFQVTIEKENVARIIQLNRLAKDSNGDLSLVLNSSAFGPGEYLLKFEGYNWRGQTDDVGWVKLSLEK